MKIWQGLLVALFFPAFVWGLSLPTDLETQNVVDTKADTVMTYSGRTLTLSWCHARDDVTFDLEVINLASEATVIAVTNLQGRTAEWKVPRAGTYMVRIRTRYPDDSVSEWNESHTNGSVQSTGCAVGSNFLVNAWLAPPTGGGGFE